MLLSLLSLDANLFYNIYTLFSSAITLFFGAGALFLSIDTLFSDIIVLISDTSILFSSINTFFPSISLFLDNNILIFDIFLYAHFLFLPPLLILSTFFYILKLASVWHMLFFNNNYLLSLSIIFIAMLLIQNKLDVQK